MFCGCGLGGVFAQVFLRLCLQLFVFGCLVWWLCLCVGCHHIEILLRRYILGGAYVWFVILMSQLSSERCHFCRYLLFLNCVWLALVDFVFLLWECLVGM